MYMWANLGGGNYSYYAIRCDNSNPVNLTTGLIDFPQGCPGMTCPQVNFPMRSFGQNKRASKHATPDDCELNDPKDRDYEIDKPRIGSGGLRARSRVGEMKIVRIEKKHSSGEYLSVRLDKYSISGVDNNGNAFDDFVYFGFEVKLDGTDQVVPASDVIPLFKHVAEVTYDGQVYLVITDHKIKE